MLIDLTTHRVVDLSSLRLWYGQVDVLWIGVWYTVNLSPRVANKRMPLLKVKGAAGAKVPVVSVHPYKIQQLWHRGILVGIHHKSSAVSLLSHLKFSEVCHGELPISSLDDADERR
jgi:hypothetical protein